MHLLSGAMAHGQAVILVVLTVLLAIFIAVNVILVLYLHSQNKKLAQKFEGDLPESVHEETSDNI